MKRNNAEVRRPENPSETRDNPPEATPASLQQLSHVIVQSYPEYPASDRNLLYNNLPGTQQPADKPKDKRPSEKISSLKVDKIAATLTGQAKKTLTPTVTPERKSELASSQNANKAQDDAYASLQALYDGQADNPEADPELGDENMEIQSFQICDGFVSHEANETSFHPQTSRGAGWYFIDMWVPWFIVLLNLLMDFILMFFLLNPYARAIQGFLFFLPWIILWNSRHNKSNYEKYYVNEGSDMPLTAWLNGLPWTGVLMLFVQESYIVLWRVLVFPFKFWYQLYQFPQRPYHLSKSIYKKSKERYLQVVRVVFEDLPTALLLIVVLARREDNGKVIFFSMVTSLASCACSMFAIIVSEDRGGRPIYFEVFKLLLDYQPRKNTTL